MWGPLIGAGLNLGSTLLGNMFSNRNAKKEMDYLNQVRGVGEQYLKPFIGRGEAAQDQASQAYQQMLQNPTTFVDQIMSSYKPSQGYQFREKSALDAARNAAAAGGFSGTGYDQREQAGLVSGLLGQDMQQYLQNILGVQGTGLSGQQHVANQGFNASNSLADYIGTSLGNQAMLKQAQNRQSAANLGGLLGAAGQFAGAGANILGSGQFGGPAGALSKIFGGFK